MPKITKKQIARAAARQAAVNDVKITKHPLGGYNVLLAEGSAFELYICINAPVRDAEYRALKVAHALICHADPEASMVEIDPLLATIKAP